MPIPRNPLPSVEYLTKYLDYNPETGEFHWKPRELSAFASYNAFRTWNSRFANKIAGWNLRSSNRIYIAFTVDYKKYLAHRVAWKIMTGNDPIEEIDHEDGNGLNNKWNNLREATRNDQVANSTQRETITGLKGVQAVNGKFRAYVVRDGKFRHIGMFDTAEQAHLAYCEEAKKLHGEFFNSGAKYDNAISTIIPEDEL